MPPTTRATTQPTARPAGEPATELAVSGGTDSSSLAIRLLLVTLTAIGVIGILLVAPAEAAVSLP